MEERSGAHRVTQRLLDGLPAGEPSEPVESPPEADGADPGAPAQSSPPPPELPRGPSDTLLRERQKAWRRERARYDAVKAARTDVADR